MREVASTTVGIDLASQPVDTAACRIHWVDGRGNVELARTQRLTDAALLKMMRDPSVTKVAIDAPFGWPDEFIDALIAYRESGVWPDPPDQRSAQRLMELRSTDRAVWAALGRKPLSVSTDRIAFAAMRCARLLAALAAGGLAVDRSGEGRVLEVYPEAALRCWSLSPALAAQDPGGYKGGTPAARTRRTRLVDLLVEQTQEWLIMDDAMVEALHDSDDQLDALLCALLARAAELGRLQPIEDPAHAVTEGWIRLPVAGSLSQLVGE